MLIALSGRSWPQFPQGPVVYRVSAVWVVAQRVERRELHPTRRVGVVIPVEFCTHGRGSVVRDALVRQPILVRRRGGIGE